MNDMRKTIVPKSDQLNADDLIGGQSKTIKITGATIKTGEQPVSLHYEGDNGKPFKPCKSMCRVLVELWGDKSSEYIGRSMTLYRDDHVKWAGEEVGGIRISHLSHITQPRTMALTASKSVRRPFTVQPLIRGDASARKDEGAGHTALVHTPAISLQDALDDIASAPNLDGLKHKYDTAVRAFKTDDERKQIIAAKEKRKTELTTEGTPS